ncbi:ankyrin repeat domain-containing protein [Flavobacterium ginsenosidimutans]|uniref:Ankyrin repeat domain-containing protein n=1 Tax=Flavobacterium ginsenosidimutans TaxID=687844 RepID=A0ABZ2QAZ4_9FLAO|nr:ankyrin repeat domain-containing protein [Flavobacterium ginsenosidimutans]KAF2338871.1 ankyrin repeat domain-containing protein [Flavobacterium ginsenosidimutans]
MKKTVIILGTIFLFGNVTIASNSGLRIKNQIEFTLYGKSPLHLAISKGDIEAVKKFVIYGTDINKKVNNMTPLMVAARFNQFEIINFLLLHNANPSIENSQGFTALDYAEYAKSTESIAILKKIKEGSRRNSK